MQFSSYVYAFMFFIYTKYKIKNFCGILKKEIKKNKNVIHKVNKNIKSILLCFKIIPKIVSKVSCQVFTISVKIFSLFACRLNFADLFIISLYKIKRCVAEVYWS